MTEENTKTAYKVVREQDGAWQSAIINGKACVAYRLGERSYGFEGTPVMVFRSVGHARSWAREWPDRAILRGSAGNLRPQRSLVQFGNWGIEWRLRAFRRFWERGDDYLGGTQGAPVGTHAADWFEPEKVVQP